MPALRLRRLLAAVAAGGLAATMGPAAAARADEPVPVPDPGAITLTGDGYGHGVGMSQYGAYSAAYNGLAGYKKILRFYYRGIDKRFGEARGRMKVLVSADNSTLIVRDAPGLVVRRVDSGRTFHLDGVKRAKRWRVRAVGDDRSEVAYRSRGWHVLRTIRGDVELQAHGPLSLLVAGGVRDYRGALRSASYDGHRVTVDVLPMEAYVRGVVTSEMYSNWPQQALRAQAVASRTYAAYERAHTARAAYDLCDTASCQAYRGVAGESSGGTKAARATAHQVLTDDGELAYAQFSASNGGWTVADDRFPYLQAREDDWEGTSTDYYGWTKTLSDADVEAQWPAIGNLTSLTVDQRDGHDRDASRGGRALTLTLTGDAGSVDVDAATFQRRFGLRSTLFTVVACAPDQATPDCPS
ncbi:SpoIID/LytB domain-containing protein [Nocardioides panaciterrulae]|uniref:SpoIID/LytB domain protein n=1 Tax=Nocardioides panaciterrulae TaxID=661492 RepID=A0A7Y9J9R1_9ACTN|nr:SpoIID/LytB domain-containing protein [Nocardioides panaciterrulae]NYD40882.1 SpoIID/LytB domain protein [Nocardioides panaciterrulae]